MKTRNSGTLLFCLLMLASISTVAEDNDIPASQREAAEKRMELAKNFMRNTAISFYGKVIDQNEKPVAGANVVLYIHHFVSSPDMHDECKTVTALTDNAGVFSVEQESGRELYVKTISKSGYERPFLEAEKCFFHYTELVGQKLFVAEKKAPVIFRLRKKGETAFLLRSLDWRCPISARESGKSKGYDFIQRTLLSDLSKPVMNGETLVPDLQIKATLNTNTATWTVVLSSGTTNGDLIVSDQLLYEAPTTGYQSEYIFTPEVRNQKTKYIYLRSRDPVIYSRLDVAYYGANEEHFRIEGKAVTNPYGDRNLEEATDVTCEFTKKLTDEVCAAFRQNKRPIKPDNLQQMIKDAQAGVESK